MYFAIVRQFSKTLSNLDAILNKATQFADAKKFPVDNFVTFRLAPDMLTFARQIQIACDVAKGAASGASGKEAPKFEDNETTIAQLRERIAKTRAYLETFSPADFEKLTAKSVVKIPYPPGKAMHAEEAIVSRAVPNFFFHITTAYALLRSGGVDIGKMDYLGDLNIFDA